MGAIRKTNASQKGFGVFSFILILVLLLLLAWVGLSYKRWEGQAPVVQLDRDLKFLGKNPALNLKIEDAGTGLRQVKVTLKQKDQVITLVDETYAGPGGLFWRAGKQQSRRFDLGKLIQEKCKIQESSATLRVEARDYSFRHFFGGNQAALQRDFAFKLYPPRLEVISSQHYINQGGSECVVYKVSPDAIVSGVQVGPHFFPGFAVPGADATQKFALFAFAYNLPVDTPLKLVARDGAGNESVAAFWYKLFPKKFRTREMPIDDKFLNKVVPEIMSHTPQIQDQGELVKTFVELNSHLRRINHEQVASLARKSPPQLLWKDAFVQLSNSKVESSFADHRQYIYQGKQVDEQDHVGYDLSVTQQYPVEAANDGVVVWADYFGIYGNAVIIDHGCGLLSLYGHLSSIGVKAGQSVAKKQIVGRSGASGLAGGDHLHFGVFLQDVPVNPTEWWDQKWVNEHVLNRINEKH